MGFQTLRNLEHFELLNIREQVGIQIRTVQKVPKFEHNHVQNADKSSDFFVMCSPVSLENFIIIHQY